MSKDTEPMREPSVPSEKVRGPLDLVARMNEATSEDYAMVPYPARQQLGDHSEPYDSGTSERPGLAAYVGKEGGEDMLHSQELSEPNLNLARPVTYHLEATEPPAEPAGAPGTAGYNKLNRGVPAAEGYEQSEDYSLEQGAGVRTFRLPENVGLETEEQAKVDGAGPFAPAPVFTNGDPKNIKEDTRERSSQTPSVNDPYRNPDGSLKDPNEVQEAAPAYPDSDFGAKEVVQEDQEPVQAAVDTEGAKKEGGPDPAEGKDQTTEPVGGASEEDQERSGRRGGRRKASE
jgi:hypothetical protein